MSTQASKGPRILTSPAPYRDSAESLLQKTLATGGRARLSAFGACMAPLINDGDDVVVEALDGRPARGAIVVARNQDNALVCHRVLGNEDDQLLLCGDVAGVLENHSAASIIGRVRSIERGAEQIHLPDTPHIVDRILARLHLYALQRRPALIARIIGRLHRFMRHKAHS